MKPLAFHISLADDLAEELVSESLVAGEFEFRHFPDGESYVRLVTPVRDRDVLLLCSLDGPDAKLLPLLFAARAARELGARRVGLVAPYLAYMRQDKAFHSGEAITSTYFAQLLSGAFDWLVTCDPHLHRHTSLGEIYSIDTAVISAAGPIARWIAERVRSPMLFGPDEESEQWVSQIAGQIGASFSVFAKQRSGDRAVRISGNADLAGRTPVIIDDIVSSARTMAEAVKLLRTQGATAPICLGVHGLFAGDAMATLRDAGAGEIVTSNSVYHATNGFSVAPELLEAISSWLRREPTT